MSVKICVDARRLYPRTETGYPDRAYLLSRPSIFFILLEWRFCCLRSRLADHHIDYRDPDDEPSEVREGMFSGPLGVAVLVVILVGLAGLAYFVLRTSGAVLPPRSDEPDTLDAKRDLLEGPPGGG